MTEQFKQEILRADEVADLDPYNVRGKTKTEAARERLPSADENSTKVEKVKEGFFNNEQTKILAENKFKRFELRGRTVEEIIDKIPIEFHGLSENMNEINTIKSMQGEVAIKTNKTGFFIPDSGSKNYFKQSGMVHAYENEVVIPLGLRGVQSILGNLADYLELALINLSLFGAKYGYYYTITESKIDHYRNGRSALAVGARDPSGIHVLSSGLDYKRGDIVFAAPLIVPFRA